MNKQHAHNGSNAPVLVTLIFAFLVRVHSWRALIVVPFIFDIYISKKIPWWFWKKSKNPTVRSS